MQETNLYKTVTLTNDEHMQIELAMLARIGQLRERLQSNRDRILVPMSGETCAVIKQTIRLTESDLVVAFDALTALTQGRPTA